MAYGLDAVQQYPKSVKFTVGNHIIELMSEMADLTIEVKKKYTKKTTLQKLDIDKEKLMFFIRLSHDRKYISDGRYNEWSSKVSEIGKIIGGWIERLSERPNKG